MEFEWDENKYEINLAKHDIDFADVVVVFEDPNKINIIDDRKDYGELRIRTMAIVRYTREEIAKMPSRTNWEKLRNMTDDDIDYSDISPTTDEMFARATRGNVKPEMPEKLTLYVLPSLLSDYRSRIGKNWRTHLSNNVEMWLRQSQTVAAL